MVKGEVHHVNFERPLTDDPGSSYTLPSRYYTDPAIFDLERERIFHRSWMYFCHASQIADPDDYLADTIIDQGIFVLRDRHGELRGFHNVCQHRAHQLVEGSGNVKAIITCPYHAWAYGLDGSLRTARNCDHVAGFDKSDFSLRPVQVEVMCGLVFVNLDPGATALAQQAPNLAADIQRELPCWNDLKIAEVYDFGGRAMEAGWKVVIDNYVECYHCEVSHPQFCDLICMPTYEHTIDGITTLQKGWDVRHDNSAYHLPEDARMPHSLFWYVWPTTTINVMPGDGDLMISNVVPVGPLLSRFVSHRLSVDGAPDRPDRRNYLENVLGVEDLMLCESVQRGLFSRGYDQGRFIVDDQKSGIGEHVVHHFHRMVMDALTDQDNVPKRSR